MTTSEDRWAIFDSDLFGEGYTSFPKAVQFDGSLSDRARFLYSLILSYAWDNPYAFPGRKRLCEDMGCNQDYLSKFLDELEDVWIKRRRRGQGKTNLYIFLTSRGVLTQDVTTLMNSRVHDGSETNNKQYTNLPSWQTEKDKSKWTARHWTGKTIDMVEDIDFHPERRQVQTWSNEFKSRLEKGQTPEYLTRLQSGVVRGASYGYFWSLKKAEQKLELKPGQPQEDDVRYLN
jgi:hypothetical protein